MNAQDQTQPIPQIIRAADHLIGLRSGVMVVEYGDFECPSCARIYPDVTHLLKYFSGKIGFVFRNFPHPDIHPNSETAAEAAEAAAAQGQFWAMYDLLYQNSRNLGGKHLRQYAEAIGLNLMQYDQEMTEHIHLQRVEEHISEGNSCGVKSTPAFFVDGNRVDEKAGAYDLFTAVESALLRRQ